MNQDRRTGFTLIELSIVLVIIGLIVGGVLVGQDLIAAATLRAQISQIEQYNAAANTFRGNYNALPGDITQSQAAQIGFVARVGTGGAGDGNGMIQGGKELDSTEPAGEVVLFWNDLSTAGLIGGNYVGIGCSYNDGTCTGTSATVPLGNILPPAKLRSGDYVMVYADSGINYFQIMGGQNAGINAGGGYFTGSLAHSMTALESQVIDIKIDDGMPMTGNVVIRHSAFSPWGAPPSGSAIIPQGTSCPDITVTPNIYLVKAPYGTQVYCSLGFKFQ